MGTDGRDWTDETEELGHILLASLDWFCMHGYDSDLCMLKRPCDYDWPDKTGKLGHILLAAPDWFCMHRYDSDLCMLKESGD